jgi:hypothetical protein
MGASPNLGDGRRRVRKASLELRIPPRPRHRRRGHYISPGTQSLSLVVTPAGAGSPTPLPTQIFNVAPPACTTLPAGGMQCQFSALVQPGRDQFVFAAYPAPNAQGSPLSVASSGVEVIPTPGPGGVTPPLAFSLEGVVRSLKVGFNDPVMPLSATSAAIPAGTPSPTGLDIKAIDAAGFQILEATPAPGHTMTPYDNPFTVAVSPAGTGMTLAKNGGAPATSVTIDGPSDVLVANYDGSLKYSGTTLQTSWTITASPNPGSAGQGTIELASSGVGYSLGQAIDSNANQGAQMLATDGASMYASILDPTSATGETVAIPLANPQAPKDAASGFASNGTFFDTFGDMWSMSVSNAKLLCFTAGTPAGGTPALTIDLAAISPAGTVSIGPDALAEGAQNQIWFAFSAFNSSTSMFLYGIGNLPLSGACQTTSSPQVNVQVVSGGVGGNSTPNSIAAIPGTSNVWVGDDSREYIYQASPNPGASPNVANIALNDNGVAGLTSNASTVYAATDFTGATINTLDVTGTLTPLATSPWNSIGFGPVISTSGVLLFADRQSAAVDLFDQATATALQLPLPAAEDCTAVAFDKYGNPWAVCEADAGGGNWTQDAYRMVLTPTWGVLPGTSISLAEPDCASSFTLAMPEKLGQDSGPFSASSSAPAIVSVTGALPQIDHAIGLNITSRTGTATVTVTDAHARSVAVSFTISSTGQSCDTVRRGGVRRHVSRSQGHF